MKTEEAEELEEESVVKNTHPKDRTASTQSYEFHPE